MKNGIKLLKVDAICFQSLGIQAFLVTAVFQIVVDVCL